MSRVFFVGPLPPPVHGFSWVNSQVHDLVGRKCEVIHFDRNPSPKGGFATLVVFASVLLKFFIKLLISRPSVVYIGWSGGISMLVDFLYVCLCRLFFVPVCLHHHSFAYLNQVRWFNRLALALTTRQFHVVLCQLMGDLLAEKYGVIDENIRVVSNAAFLPSATVPVFKPPEKIVVGFLSNVTEAKGIFEFFALAEKFSSDHRFLFKVAGPVSAEIRQSFELKLSGLPNVTHVGAVYSGDKEVFLQSLDIFVFPTKYVNEAEPVSISEAMRFGLPVISIVRGCIAGMLGSSGLATTLESFLLDASSYLLNMAEDGVFYVSERQKAIKRFNDLRVESLANLETLVDHLSGGRLQ